MRLVACLLSLLMLGTAWAQVQSHEGFDDPVLDARYRELTRSIRCMKCANQSIADSPLEVAEDVRRQVREKIVEGQSDAEILDYFASRYGDYILYRPPFKPSTWLLWAGPGLLLVGGGIVFARTLRARMQQPLEEDSE